MNAKILIQKQWKKVNIKFKIKEIFGPVLSVFVYEDERYDETLHLLDTTSEYALTGSIFAKDRKVIDYTSKVLENSSGNLYINDKSTGAVVGQQPL